MLNLYEKDLQAWCFTSLKYNEHNCWRLQVKLVHIIILNKYLSFMHMLHSLEFSLFEEDVKGACSHEIMG